MENFFLSYNLSWTLSKTLPYLLILVGGVFLSYFYYKKVKKLTFLRFIIWIIPFAIYFILNPIYEGDFSNSFRNLKLKNAFIQSEKNQLIVITIPGCPYCMASIQTIKNIKKRVPNLNVKYVICSSDSSSTDIYKKEINGAFPINIATNAQFYANLTMGRFPSFMLVSNSSAQIWSNDAFGSLAKDNVESYFKSLN